MLGIPMPERFEDQPWYPEWKRTVDRVVTARMELDATKPGTPEWEAADREYESALAAFRAAADEHRPKPS
jgi:hypothetical protein